MTRQKLFHQKFFKHFSIATLMLKNLHHHLPEVNFLFVYVVLNSIPVVVCYLLFNMTLSVLDMPYCMFHSKNLRARLILMASSNVEVVR